MGQRVDAAVGLFGLEIFQDAVSTWAGVREEEREIAYSLARTLRTRRITTRHVPALGPSGVRPPEPICQGERPQSRLSRRASSIRSPKGDGRDGQRRAAIPKSCQPFVANLSVNRLKVTRCSLRLAMPAEEVGLVTRTAPRSHQGCNRPRVDAAPVVRSRPVSRRGRWRCQRDHRVHDRYRRRFIHVPMKTRSSPGRCKAGTDAAIARARAGFNPT
jgi:hypothetical protein